jgi:TPR repeat protein
MKALRICVLLVTLLFTSVCLRAQDKVVERIKEIKAKADAGNAEAQFDLGQLFYDGWGVPADYASAVKWWREAAKQGHARARNNLGNCYRMGRGVLRDDFEAWKLFRVAAFQGLAEAQANLAGMYGEGKVFEDDPEALKLILSVAERGSSSAQFNLGLMFFNGYGFAKDLSMSAKWYRSAAQQGNLDAQCNLALLLFNKGEVIEAAKWFRTAGLGGVPMAQYSYAVMCQFGEGVGKDPVEAYAWLKVASGSKYERSFEQLRIRERQLNSEEKLRASERAERILKEIANLSEEK